MIKASSLLSMSLNLSFRCLSYCLMWTILVVFDPTIDKFMSILWDLSSKPWLVLCGSWSGIFIKQVYLRLMYTLKKVWVPHSILYRWIKTILWFIISRYLLHTSIGLWMTSCCCLWYCTPSSVWRGIASAYICKIWTFTQGLVMLSSRFTPRHPWIGATHSCKICFMMWVVK